MNYNSKNHCNHSDQYTVSKRMPEVCYLHSFPEIGKTEFLWQRQDPGYTVGHLCRLLECDHNCHIKRKYHCDKAKDQKDRYRPVRFFSYFRFHYSCSSFFPVIVNCTAEMITITIKNITALALWNPNCPPLIPLL